MKDDWNYYPLMPKTSFTQRADGSRLAYILLIGFIAALIIGGGASRADALGQSLVRSVAWACLIIMALFGPRFRLRVLGFPGLLLCSVAILLVAQLLPLPPTVWQSLPGHAVFAGSTSVLGLPDVWRPIAIAPSSTLNALGSLVVPATCLLLMSAISLEQSRGILVALAFAVLVSAMLGVLTVAGSHLDNPLINEFAGDVSGSFANRNHFALFCAIGCAIIPTLASLHGGRRKAGTLAFFATIPLLWLLVLASGSRSGLIVTALATLLGLVLAKRWIAVKFASMPRKYAWVGGGILVGLASATLIAAVAFDRAFAVSRLQNSASIDDLRAQIRPTILDMISAYWPFGIGAGNFDSAYRIWEKDELLSFSYVNQAHNDVLAIPLETGLAGVVFLLVAIGWSAHRAFLSWRSGDARLGRLGAVMILLVVVASALDYPARTPMIMAVVAIASSWLSRDPSPSTNAASLKDA